MTVETRGASSTSRNFRNRASAALYHLPWNGPDLTLVWGLNLKRTCDGEVAAGYWLAGRFRSADGFASEVDEMERKIHEGWTVESELALDDASARLLEFLDKHLGVKANVVSGGMEGFRIWGAGWRLADQKVSVQLVDDDGYLSGFVNGVRDIES